MNYNFSIEKMLWILAGLVILIGCVLTFRSVSTFSRQSHWIDSKTADLERLESIGASFAEMKAGLQSFDEMGSDKLERLETVLESSGMETNSQVSYGSVEDLWSGWRIQKATVVMEQVDAVKLLGAIARLEDMRPPWRVDGLSMQSVPEGAGAVRARLTLEGVER